MKGLISLGLNRLIIPIITKSTVFGATGLSRINLIVITVPAMGHKGYCNSVQIMI